MKLADYSQEQQNEMAYPALCELRCEAYEAHAGAMTIPTEISDWASKMEYRNLNSGEYSLFCQRNEMVESHEHRARWSKTMGVWANRVSLVAGLLIVRYGEEPSHWPTTFTDKDIDRSQTWLNGRVPGAVISAAKRGV